jgi:hypothetical protein
VLINGGFMREFMLRFFVLVVLLGAQFAGYKLAEAAKEAGGIKQAMTQLFEKP